MKILVIGGGGREHALAWKLTQSPQVQMVYVAPGNAGISRNKNLQMVDLTDSVALRQWAQDNDIGLTVVGPEAPLAAGETVPVKLKFAKAGEVEVKMPVNAMGQHGGASKH